MTNTVIGNSVNLEGNYWGIVRMGSVNRLIFFFLWDLSHGSKVILGNFCGIFRMGPR
jgi:hypothetical protein